MIVVDTSALIAIILNEPERMTFISAIEDAGQAYISTATLIETRVVAHNRGGEQLVLLLDGVVQTLGLEALPPSLAEVSAAHDAFITYGKGRGHPAQLNFGDLFSYALAKVRGVPLLFKGDDFGYTDIESAVGDLVSKRNEI
ncbi:MAG: type II toxin-antitoxin system VapC family toxin [Chakrabartia sp.]